MSKEKNQWARDGGRKKDVAHTTVKPVSKNKALWDKPEHAWISGTRMQETWINDSQIYTHTIFPACEQLSWSMWAPIPLKHIDVSNLKFPFTHNSQCNFPVLGNSLFWISWPHLVCHYLQQSSHHSGHQWPIDHCYMLTSSLCLSVVLCPVAPTL